MAEPLMRSGQWMKPAPYAFRQWQAAPAWRWFWQLCVFADPLWGLSRTGSANGGAWDHASWLGPQLLGTFTFGIGPRGRRQLWGATTYGYGTTGGAANGIRAAYNQNADVSMFCVHQTTVPTTSDNILSWEGGVGETLAENSTMSVNINGIDPYEYQYIHESGAGTNTAIQPTGSVDSTRNSFAITRDSVNKVVKHYKNGSPDYASNGYATNPATSTLYVTLGSRADGTNPSDQYIECMYLFKSLLTESMIAALHQDPRGPFRTVRAASAGGGPGGGGTGVRSFVAGMVG
jgi:hypothetical protein